MIRKPGKKSKGRSSHPRWRAGGPLDRLLNLIAQRVRRKLQSRIETEADRNGGNDDPDIPVEREDQGWSHSLPPFTSC